MTSAMPEPILAPDAATTGPLITDTELATICRLADQVIPADRQPFATMIIDLASDIVRDYARHPEWDQNTVPFRAKMICLHVAKRVGRLDADCRAWIAKESGNWADALN